MNKELSELKGNTYVASSFKRFKMLIKDQKKFSNAVKSFVNKVIKGKTILIFFSSFKIIISIIIISTISTTVRYTIKNCSMK